MSQVSSSDNYTTRKKNELQQKRKQETAEWNMKRRMMMDEAKYRIKIMNMENNAHIKNMEMRHEVDMKHKNNELQILSKELKTRQEILQVIEKQHEVIKVTKEDEDSIAPEPMTMEGPYTMQRIAEHFGLLDHITDPEMRARILANADRLAVERYNITPIGIIEQQ